MISLFLSALLFHSFSSAGIDQNPDFENSWKLYKIEENGVQQPYVDQCILFYDPKGIYGCFNKEDNEFMLWGQWTRKKNILNIVSGDSSCKQFIHNWTDSEIVISTMEQKERKYYYKK